jgi:hypothetical protein
MRDCVLSGFIQLKSLSRLAITPFDLRIKQLNIFTRINYHIASRYSNIVVSLSLKARCGSN